MQPYPATDLPPRPRVGLEGVLEGFSKTLQGSVGLSDGSILVPRYTPSNDMGSG